MRICYLFYFFLYSSSVVANFFKPLDFEKIRPESTLGHLLQSVTLLFYDIQSLDLSDEKKIKQIIARQIDLIGAIYIFKYQQKSSIWREDLLYFADLVFRINLEFEALEKDLSSSQIQLINQLFLQIDLLLKELLDFS